MKQKRRQYVLRFMLVSFLWCSLVPKAQADATDLLAKIEQHTQDTVTAVNNVLNLLTSTGQQILNALTAPTPQVAELTKANTQIGLGISKAQTDYELPLTTDAINALMTNTTDNAANSSEIPLVNLPGPDFPSYRSFAVAPNVKLTLPAASAQGPSPFDINTLLGQVAFPDGSAQGSDCQSGPKASSANKPLCQSYAAQSVIGYISGLSSPPVVPSFSGLKAKGVSEDAVKQFRTSGKVQDYLADLRNYVSAQSVGLSNFYSLYAERVIQTGLGTTLNVHTFGTVDGKGNVTPGEPIPDVSALQAEEFLAKRRVYDPTWYKNMESATSPLTLAREAVYILAEIRLELFKTRMDNERLLAAMSAMQLQSLKTQKSLMDQRASTITMPKSAAASTPPPTPPAIPAPPPTTIPKPAGGL